MGVDSTEARQTIVSAPGKVLLAGGYLVLDRTYSGLVVATSSRFYCVVDHQLSEAASSTGSIPITVQAGQFPKTDSVWSYSLSAKSTGGFELKQDDEKRNKFVEITLTKALEVVLERLTVIYGDGAYNELEERVTGGATGMRIVVLADNDFYSQRDTLAASNLPNRISSLSSIPPFSPLPQPIQKTNKTGLGSSAALVTSLTAALLHHLGIVRIPKFHRDSQKVQLNPALATGSSSGSGLDLIHSLSQFSHCLAQGKVGSGFDISSAVYGTHIYRRFSPSILTPLLSDPSSSDSPSTSILSHMDPSKWDTEIKPFRLPKGLRLLLADVDAGTDTPSFVGKVLKWREREGGVAKDLWDRLGAANEGLGEGLRSLCEMEGDAGYMQALGEAASLEIEALDIGKAIHQILVRIRASLVLIRSYLQQMSVLSDVPIEPPEQTRLLDTCSSCPGVLGGGVPGAGGYDAIFLLVIDTPEVVSAVENVWEGWKELSVCPLKARQSDGGLRLEILDKVGGLQEALRR